MERAKQRRRWVGTACLLNDCHCMNRQLPSKSAASTSGGAHLLSHTLQHPPSKKNSKLCCFPSRGGPNHNRIIARADALPIGTKHWSPGTPLLRLGALASLAFFGKFLVLFTRRGEDQLKKMRGSSLSTVAVPQNRLYRCVTRGR